MMDTRTMAHSHRANRRTAALKTIATMFTMNAMVAARLHQIKVPRPDAYGRSGNACDNRRLTPLQHSP